MRSLTAALGVRAGERRPAAWVALVFLVTQAGHGLGANTADALFFARFGVEFLPQMILLAGLATMAAGIVYSAGLVRIGSRRWLWLVALGFATWMAVERLGIALDAPVIYPIVWLSGQVVILTTFTLMWNVAGEVCTTRQAKRLFPLFASAGIAGGVIGNAITGPLAAGLGTENLLIVHGGLLALVAALTYRVGRTFFRSGPDEGGGSVLADLRVGLDITRRTPLLRLVAVAAVLFSALFFQVVFPFSEAVARSFDSEAQIAGFLGVFSAVATGVTFLVSLLVTNRLFARFGVVVTLLLVPVLYVVGFSVWLGSFGLATAALVRGGQWVAVNALQGTAWTALFNVLGGRRRSQVMAFIAAVPSQLGTVLAGLVLIGGSYFAFTARTALGLAMAIAATIVVIRMRPAYVAALVEAVRKGMVHVFTTTHAGIQKPVLDADVLEAVGNRLRDPRPTARAVTAGMLGRLGDPQAAGLLVPALSDEAAEVRMAAFEALQAVGAASLAERAEALLTDPSPAIRRRAMQWLVDAGGANEEALRLALGDEDPWVRSGAAGLTGGPAARQAVEAMLDSTDPPALAAALSTLADHPELSSRDPSEFVSHPDRGVRAAAAAALAGRPGVDEVLRGLLDDPCGGVRHAAAVGLTRQPAGTHMLLDTLVGGSVRSREASLEAMVETNVSPDHVRAWAEMQLRRATDLRRYRIALERGRDLPTRAYLRTVLARRQLMLERWSLQAMATPETAATLRVVARGAWSDDPEVRASAVEALDSIGERALTRSLIPLLEDDQLEVGLDERTALDRLMNDRDPWIRALAIRCQTDELLADLQHVRKAASEDSSPLVRSVVAGWDPPMDVIETLGILDRVLALQRVPMFSDLDPEDLERIATVAGERRFEPGEVIYRYGEEGDEMLAVIEGSVVVQRDQSGEVEILSRHGPGQHVGELALLRKQPRMADVVAGDDGVHGLVIRNAELQSILEDRPEVALGMLATLAERLGRM